MKMKLKLRLEIKNTTDIFNKNILFKILRALLNFSTHCLKYHRHFKRIAGHFK
jgi:hypothetical protein